MEGGYKLLTMLANPPKGGPVLPGSLCPNFKLVESLTLYAFLF
jgi:hypothetical protein